MSFKVTNNHWEIIVNFMESHPDFAKNRLNSASGRDTMKRLWEDLAKKLNSIGLGERSVQKWQKTWTDYKYILKRKAADIKTDITGTGGGPPKGSLLTELDKRILGILGPSFYEGLGLQENGCNFLKLSDRSDNPEAVFFVSPVSTRSATLLTNPVAKTPQGPSISSTVIGAHETCVESDNIDYTENSQQRTVCTKNVNKRLFNDHDYIRQPLQKQPKRVRPDSRLEDMYAETVTEIREIKCSLKELNKTAQGIEVALVSLVEAVKQKNV